MPDRSTPARAGVRGIAPTRLAWLRVATIALLALITVASMPAAALAADPTPTPGASVAPSADPSASPSPAPSSAPSASPSPSPAASPSASPAASASPSPTAPPSPAPSPSPSTSPGPSPSPSPAPPVAAIAALPSPALSTLPVTLFDASTGAIATRTWAFGDGAQVITAAAAVSHTYARGGTYTILLTVTGPGGSRSATANLTVTTPYRLDLYRRTAYVRQYTSTWCVGAAIQMMTNIVLRRSDVRWARQYYLMRLARAHDTLPWWRPGSDPAGWAAALRLVGAGRSYRWLRFSTREAAIEYAARRIEATHKPVGILAWNGAHAWVMTGFVARVDPASTTSPVVAAVIVSGPLGRSRDPVDWVMPMASFAPWFGPYRQRDGWLGWVGRYVIVAP